MPIESIRLRPVVTSTSVTSASQYDDSRGVSTGTSMIGTLRPRSTSAATPQHVDVGQLVGAADLEDPAERAPRGRATPTR